MATRLTIYELDDDELIKLGRQFIELHERLRIEAQTDPARTPIPSLIAKLMGISLEEAIELQDYAFTMLGDHEANQIRAAATEYFNIDGHPIKERYQ